MARVLILGGTREALACAQERVQAGDDVLTSLAGRTREPVPPAGRVRTGGFGGAEGLADFLREHAIDVLIDATHPFAVTISRNAREASRRTGVPLTVIERTPWQEVKGDRWERVSAIEDAVARVPAGARVLLALGSQHIAPFAARTDVHFVVRMIDAPSDPMPFASSTLLLQRPSADWRDEADMLTMHEVDCIVCRNSGGAGAYAKIEAARRLSLPIIMIARPEPPSQPI